MNLIITPTAGLIGGTERVLELLLLQIDARSGFAVAFLTAGPLAELARERGIPCTVIERGRLSRPWHFSRAVRRLRSFVRQINATHVLAWTEFACFYAKPAALGLAPASFWQRGGVGGWQGRALRWMPGVGVFANSQFTAQKLRAAGHSGEIRVLHPVYEYETFGARPPITSTDARKKLGLPREGFWVGNVGRLQQWKGFDTYVDALARIMGKRSEVRGLIVGGRHDLEPGYETALRRRVASLGLTDRIHFAGPQRNVADWMSAMDVVVHSAETEPFGIVVVEAMALGKPVIASIPGGPAEVITDGVDGLLVRTGNVDELASAIEKLMTNQPLRESIAKVAPIRAAAFSDQRLPQRLCMLMRGVNLAGDSSNVCPEIP